MHDPLIIAYDLGTGGSKASLYDAQGGCLVARFVPYDTTYPRAGWHEQRPEDWWQAVVASTRQLLAAAAVDPERIACCGISGHSLGVVPVDRAGTLLRDAIPIWSDSRPQEQAAAFFRTMDETAWYLRTGCGFPPPLYALFKIMWYRDHEPAMFRRIARVIGTKDYVNLRLTGRIATDHSYASGSGAWDLERWAYADDLIAAAGLSRDLFPESLPSTAVLGTLTAEAAAALGLPRRVQVVAGGVDNSCMALGARLIEEGRSYNSLGTSAWIAVCSARPLLHPRSRPYVFAHVLPGLFNSATAIFSAGSSFRWVRDRICADLVRDAAATGGDPYELMTALAATAPPGANRLLFNPSLAGGSALDDSPRIRGALIGLDLGHTRADVVRAAMEGIAFGLRVAFDDLRRLAPVQAPMLVVGGGSRSRLWRQIHADIYGTDILKTNIDQQAAALGAAALAAVGTGMWRDFSIIDRIHELEDVAHPIPDHVAVYARLLPVFIEAAKCQARLGDQLAAL